MYVTSLSVSPFVGTNSDSQLEDWELKVGIEQTDKVRTKFRLAVMSQKLVGTSKPEAITQALINHCVETTKRSRNWMEANPNQRLPKDYRAFPGKQDHTSCISIRVARLPIDDQLQYKIDEKMRHLHRKEMQAQIAAKHEEAARTRQVLSTGLFSRSLTVKPTGPLQSHSGSSGGSSSSNSNSKPPPRLADARQNTFTVLNSQQTQAAPVVKTPKSRSLVDMRRPRGQSLDVQPSWTQDPVRASPPRLERSKIPALRTDMIIGGEPAGKPQMAQASARHAKPDPCAYPRCLLLLPRRSLPRSVFVARRRVGADRRARHDQVGEHSSHRGAARAVAPRRRDAWCVSSSRESWGFCSR